MKDYPIQRYVRDARITNIYEGTSQLQVVAAIRGVTTGQYAKHIREVYEKMEIARTRIPARNPEMHDR